MLTHIVDLHFSNPFGSPVCSLIVRQTRVRDLSLDIDYGAIY